MRTRTFEIGLAELLTPAERTCTVAGTTGGAGGINCNVHIQDVPLTGGTGRLCRKASRP